MKSIYISIFLLFSIALQAQKKQPGADLILFEKTLGIQQLLDDELKYLSEVNDTVDNPEQKTTHEFALEVRETLLDKVIEGYDELLTEFPKSKVKFRALNNKGLAELELKDYDAAKETYVQILNSNANDGEKGGIGSGIMAEPYANYKNRAAKILAGLELEDGNYQNALKYLDKTKKYPYQHFCGNEFAADEIYMADMYARCYLALNQDEKAYDILLPNILENGLADNSGLVRIAFDALTKTHKKDSLKIQFENAFKNVGGEIEKKGKYEYTNYYITFLNRKIPLNSWQLYGALSDDQRKKAIDDVLVTSEFYQLLRN